MVTKNVTEIRKTFKRLAKATKGLFGSAIIMRAGADLRNSAEEISRERDALFEQAERMAKLTEQLNERMELINGQDHKCIDHPMTCPNHSLIHEANSALQSWQEFKDKIK